MGNTDAWDAFVKRYRPAMVDWCRRSGAQPAEAEDVAQTVLLKLIEKMKAFEYDRTRGFRKWLRTVTRHAWLDYVDARRRGVQGTGRSAFWETLDHHAAGASLEVLIEEAWQRELAERAMAQVRTEVHGKTWRAFELVAVEGRKSPEAGKLLGMTPGAVLMARHRVTKRLRELIAELEADPL